MNFKILICLCLVLALTSAKKSRLTKNEIKNLEANTFNGCTGSDCVIYDLSTENTCTLKSGTPTYNMNWVKGLSLNVDFQLAGGRIIYYRIQSFSGSFSPYYVPGINDIDTKKNSDQTMRRMWAYFYDHSYEYLVCA